MCCVEVDLLNLSRKLVRSRAKWWLITLYLVEQTVFYRGLLDKDVNILGDMDIIA